MWTPAFERFVDPARRKPALWRLLVGVLVIFAVYLGLFFATTLALGFGAAASSPDPVAARAWLEDFLTGRTPTGVVVVLLTFGYMVIGVGLAARWLHGRGLRDLAGPHLARDFVPALAITALVGATAAALAFDADGLVRNAPLDLFLTFLPAALLALLVQTGAEELVFRGYMQTQLAARFRSPWVWMVVPSVIFGALHTDPAALLETGRLAANDGLIFLATTLVGLLAADLTRVTGGIGAAWGLHFANNVQALLVVSLDDLLSGLAFWRTPFGRDDLEALPLLLAVDMLVLLAIWGAIRVWLARRRDGADGADTPA